MEEDEEVCWPKRTRMGVSDRDRSRTRLSKAGRPVSTEPIPTDGKRRPEDLTPREVEILRLIWEGHTNRSIAACLKISMKTADTHRANMMKKLRASNTAQLLKAALERKLLQTTDVDAQVSGVQ
jgi:DNA-binding NarL/FixJ family response regulator